MTDKKIFHVGIGLPSTHLWESDFGLSFANLCMYSMQVQVPGYNGNSIQVINKRGSILPQLRHDIVKDAQALGCTHLLWIDSDQSFPKELLHRLVRHDKSIVGCNIATKVLPPSCAPTARKKSDINPFGDVVFTYDTSQGLEQVWRLGFGVILVKMKVFDDIPEPWFNLMWDEEQKKFVGEDWWFCMEAEKRGIPIWVDHDLSKDIGHIGPVKFDHSFILPHMVEQSREQYFNAQRRSSKPNLRAISPT
jgi:hypothetical protein